MDFRIYPEKYPGTDIPFGYSITLDDADFEHIANIFADAIVRRLENSDADVDVRGVDAERGTPEASQ